MKLRFAELCWPLRGCLLLLLALGVPSAGAGADDRLPQPKGPVVLSISGDIERTTDGTRALFDVSMLQALGLVTVRTRTPWTEGTAEFEGVLLRDVLRLVGARGETILASALNDYVAEIPPGDPAQHDVILALKKDGEYLTVRNMGPILVLYPFDSDPALQTEEIYARSVWQLARLEVGTPADELPADALAAVAAVEPEDPAEEPEAEALETIAPASGSSEPASEPMGAEATADPATAEPATTDTAMAEAVVEEPSAENSISAEVAAKPAADGEAIAVAPEPAATSAPDAAALRPDEVAVLGTSEGMSFEQAEPAAGETDASLAARIVNIPNGASFERNLLGAEDTP